MQAAVAVVDLAQQVELQQQAVVMVEVMAIQVLQVLQTLAAAVVVVTGSIKAQETGLMVVQA
jgi:hypothetical protein